MSKYNTSSASRADLRSFLNHLEMKDISYSMDGDIIEFDETELDRAGQNIVAKLFDAVNEAIDPLPSYEVIAGLATVLGALDVAYGIKGGDSIVIDATKALKSYIGDKINAVGPAAKRVIAKFKKDPKVKKIIMDASDPKLNKRAVDKWVDILDHINGMDISQDSKDLITNYLSKAPIHPKAKIKDLISHSKEVLEIKESNAIMEDKVVLKYYDNSHRDIFKRILRPYDTKLSSKHGGFVFDLDSDPEYRSQDYKYLQNEIGLQLDKAGYEENRDYGFQYVNENVSNETKSDIKLFEEFFVNEAKEATRGAIYKAVKKADYPVAVVVIEKGAWLNNGYKPKVVHQQLVNMPEAVPAAVKTLQKKYPLARISVESNSGLIVFTESVINEFGPGYSPQGMTRGISALVNRIGDLDVILMKDRKAEREWEEMSQRYLDGEEGSAYWGDLDDQELEDAIDDAESLMRKYRIKESVNVSESVVDTKKLIKHLNKKLNWNEGSAELETRKDQIKYWFPKGPKQDDSIFIAYSGMKGSSIAKDIRAAVKDFGAKALQVTKENGDNEHYYNIEVAKEMLNESVNEAKWLSPLGDTDDFGDPYKSLMIDGKTKRGPWANMTPKSWKSHGIGRFGVGAGQLYRLTGDDWIKVENPTPKELNESVNESGAIKLFEEYFDSLNEAPNTAYRVVGDSPTSKESNHPETVYANSEKEAIEKYRRTVKPTPINVQIVKVYESVNEREYNTEERKSMADSGEALPDGSYPIADEEDLKNAIQSFGLGKNHSAAAKHIAKRAKALGLSDLIPDTEDFQKALKS